MATGDAADLKKVGVQVGAGTYGDAGAAFTEGIACNEFSTPITFAPEPINNVAGSFQHRKTSKPPIFHDLSLGFDLDVGDNASGNIGHFLQSIFGTDTDTGSDPYQHKFTRNDTSTPTWFNLYSDKDETNKQYRGFRANSVVFTIDGEAGNIPVVVGGIYQLESALAPAQSLVYSTSDPLTAHDASTFTLGGSPVTNFKTCEITITRDNVRHKPISNLQTIANQFTQNFDIGVTMTGLNFANETEYDKFKAGTTTAFVLTLTDGNSNYITFFLDALKYNAWEPPAASSNTLLNITAGAFQTGNGGYVTLQNARAANYNA